MPCVLCVSVFSSLSLSPSAVCVCQPQLRVRIIMAVHNNARLEHEVVAQELTFRYLLHAKETHQHQIYTAKFCPIPGYLDYFCTCGKNKVTVYQVSSDGCQPRQVYVDEDPEEIFYTSAWSATLEEGTPLLLVGGIRGIIKVINCLTFVIESVMLGHGGYINDLKVHPVDDSLCLSASKDESIRLFNIRNGDCIAMFCGEKGFHIHILSILCYC